MTGGSRLRIRILGGLDACDGGAEVDLGGRRQRAVLAVLVLARGEVVPAERIADCLWGDGLPGERRRRAAVLRVAPAAPAGARRRPAVPRRGHRQRRRRATPSGCPPTRSTRGGSSGARRTAAGTGRRPRRAADC